MVPPKGRKSLSYSVRENKPIFSYPLSHPFLKFITSNQKANFSEQVKSPAKKVKLQSHSTSKQIVDSKTNKPPQSNFLETVLMSNSQIPLPPKTQQDFEAQNSLTDNETKKHFILVSWNIRSISNSKLTELLTVSQNPPDIICLQETWHGETKHLPNVQGYSCYSKKRVISRGCGKVRGGGVATYISDNRVHRESSRYSNQSKQSI